MSGVQKNEDEIPGPEAEQPEDPGRLGTFTPQGYRTGRQNIGQPRAGTEDGVASGEGRSDLEAHGYHWGGGPRSRVPEPRDVDILEEALNEAFRNGDPVNAWDLTKKLLDLSKEAVAEAARSRFRVNFGTGRCRSCDGLKAGPGVIATCFQVKQCYFRNFKEGVLTPKQVRVLKILGSEG